MSTPLKRLGVLFGAVAALVLSLPGASYANPYASHYTEPTVYRHIARTIVIDNRASSAWNVPGAAWRVDHTMTATTFRYGRCESYPTLPCVKFISGTWTDVSWAGITKGMRVLNGYLVGPARVANTPARLEVWLNDRTVRFKPGVACHEATHALGIIGHRKPGATTSCLEVPRPITPDRNLYPDAIDSAVITQAYAGVPLTR